MAHESIDLPDHVIKILEHEAIDSKPDFKNWIEVALGRIAGNSKYNKVGKILGLTEQCMQNIVDEDQK